MATDADSVADSLTTLVQVIGRDRSLSQWFGRLDQMSAIERRNQVFQMSEQMTKDGKDRDAVDAFRLLADTRIFDATRLALRECGYIEE